MRDEFWRAVEFWQALVARAFWDSYQTVAGWDSWTVALTFLGPMALIGFLYFVFEGWQELRNSYLKPLLYALLSSILIGLGIFIFKLLTLPRQMVEQASDEGWAIVEAQAIHTCTSTCKMIAHHSTHPLGHPFPVALLTRAHARAASKAASCPSVLLCSMNCARIAPVSKGNA